MRYLAYISLILLPTFSYPVDYQELYRDSLWKKKQEKNIAQSRPHLSQPYKNGTLYVSDRVVYFPDVITEDTARKFVDFISFYNTKSRDPIFVIVSGSAGGSVLHGYTMLRAIRDSLAPVHIIVQTYCYSMCAVIVATVYEKTYALETSTFLMHLPRNMIVNATSVSSASNADMLSKFEHILFSPIARRMGISVRELISRMYSAPKGRDGNWVEIGEDAVRLNWVQTIPKRIVYYYKETLDTSDNLIKAAEEKDE